MISLVAAMARNRVIGKDGAVPWGKSQKSDIKHFRKLTTGHTIIMGRKTFEEPGFPLRDRLNVVITRSPGLDTESVRYRSAEQILRYIKKRSENFYVIGGQQIFEIFMPVANRLYITQVDAEYEGDTFFPEIGSEWAQVEIECFKADDSNKHDYCFLEYDRI